MSQTLDKTENSEYLNAFRGSFTSALRWYHLDDLWRRVRRNPQGWYVYAIGEPPPQQVASAEEFTHFINQVDQLLRTEHDEDYCGIVYADNLQTPAMIKVYDPNNLGVTCGYSDNPPLPGWVLSRLQPVDLEVNIMIPRNRKHWWQRIFGA